MKYSDNKYENTLSTNTISNIQENLTSPWFRQAVSPPGGLQEAGGHEYAAQGNGGFGLELRIQKYSFSVSGRRYSRVPGHSLRCD